jgi:type II secretory pathway component PulC
MGGIIHTQKPGSASRLALITLALVAVAGLAANALGLFDGAAAPMPGAASATGPGGTAAMAQPAAAEPRAPVPNIRVRLLGVSPAGEGAGSARIEVEGRTGEWQVGQEPFPGVVLRRVASDHMVLAYGPATRTVLLAPPVAAVTAAPAEESPDLAELNRKNVDVRRLTFTRFQNADAFLRSVELAPHPRGGYEVRGVESGSMYEKLGLRVGDVLYSLDTDNTSKVDDRSLEAVMRQTHYELDVYRNGQLVHLRYRFPTSDPGDEPLAGAGAAPEAPR